jgi:hypothetical protein
MTRGSSKPIQYGTLKNANVSIDSDDGAVWLWISSGKEHAGINLSAHISMITIGSNTNALLSNAT